MQGKNFVFHWANPRDAANSTRSPLMWMSAATSPSELPACAKRSPSVGAHAEPSYLTRGRLPLASASRHHRMKANAWFKVHHPLHPHLHTLDFLKHATRCR
eukprot:366756-Alexandrium_andersonii.AAC.1